MRQPRGTFQRRFVTIGILVLVLYIYISSGYKTFVKEGTIHALPKDVWLFVSDFSKLKMINPTM